MKKIDPDLVSIIIPCYNHVKWVGQAIDSALAQTYQKKEIIVIEDGSTDGSIDIIKAYGNRISFFMTEHKNGNYARNLGLEKASGGMIQFLDADDYILPEKIARQAELMKKDKLDIVYSDWRHIYSSEDQESYFGDVVISEEKSGDVLSALFRGWWTALHSILFSKEIIDTVEGWDVNFSVAQDRDFFISLVLAGAKIGYLRGCDSVYRRYGGHSVSTGNRLDWLRGHSRALAKAEDTLNANGKMNVKYAAALAYGYFKLARVYYDKDVKEWKRLNKKVLALNQNFMPEESRLYNLIYRFAGCGFAEFCASMKRRIKNVRF